MNKRLFFFCCVCILSFLPFSSAGERLTLVEDGMTEYQILLPENPTPVQVTAAEELASYITEISGVSVPIKKDLSSNSISPDEKLLVIGPSNASKKLLAGDIDESAIEYDGIIIKQVGNTVVFSGHPVRGPLYAVDTFLEEELGCRWWTTAESTVPRSAKIEVDDFDICYAPSLIYRESFYKGVIGEGNTLFASRVKCNGNAEPIPQERGGSHHYLFFVHSFSQLIPPTEFEAHPDWFPEIDGIRKVGDPYGGTPEYREMRERLKPEQIHGAGTQLCLSNEELYQEMLRRVLKKIEENPEATIVSISQNDWEGYCTCEKCRKAAEEERSQSGVVLRFVNRMAEDIENVYPDIFVDTLAYRYTRQPPKQVKARDNVIVRLCSIECSFVQNLAGQYGESLTFPGVRRSSEKPQNTSFRADIEEWTKHAEHLFIWDYMTNFSYYLLPFPNYRIWGDNIRFFVDHQALGLFEQGDYEAISGDFVQLRAWVVAKLLWNPSLSQRDLMEEFISGYYAPELVPIYMAYFDLLTDAYEKTGLELDIYRKSTRDWLDLDTMNQATRLLDRALETASRLEKERPEECKGLVYKVQREKIPHDLVVLADYAAYTEDAQKTGKEFIAPKPEEMKAFADSICDRLDAAGVCAYTEFTSPEKFKGFVERVRAKGSDPLNADPILP